MSAHNQQEVEIKFAIGDRAALESALAEAGFRLSRPATFESNTLYDDAEGNLRRQGQVLRLRDSGGQWRLTHKSKGTNGRHKTRRECESTVGNGAAMHAILTELGYRPAFRYEKYRAEWSDGQGEVVIDETPIGLLGEIEGEPEWIDRVAEKLGVRPSDYSTASYVELFLEWKQRQGSRAENMTFEECGHEDK